jgi:ABC-2 type transport system permease protein
LLAITAMGFTISSALRLRSEETAGHAEVVLATPTSRWSWAVSHLVIAAAGSVLIMGAAGLAMGVSLAFVSGDTNQVVRMFVASLVPIPAVLVILGAVVALTGLGPRASNAAWGTLVVVFLLSYLGELLQLPQWLRSISPIDHVPALPAEDFALLPTLVLSLIAVGLTAVGLVGLRRRDLHPW